MLPQTITNHETPYERENRRRFIVQLRENLLDADIVVDDCRSDVTRSIEALELAIAARDSAAAHLTFYIAEGEALA